MPSPSTGLPVLNQSIIDGCRSANRIVVDYVEFNGGRHEKAWAPPNTLRRILARVLHAETARMARCSSARPKTARTKNSGLAESSATRRILVLTAERLLDHSVSRSHRIA